MAPRQEKVLFGISRRQLNWPARCVQSVCVLDVSAQADKPRLGELYRNNSFGDAGIFIRNGVAKSMNEQDARLRGEHRPQRDAARQWIAIPLPIAPTDLKILRTCEFQVLRPKAIRNVRRSNDDSCVQASA